MTMNNMLTDYIRMRAAASHGELPRAKGAVAPKLAASEQIQSHIFDRKDPWNWKFPQRSDTMSQSTLDEEKDQVKIYTRKTMKTARNHSLNLLSHDITGKC
jgi:hypothetical protein